MPQGRGTESNGGLDLFSDKNEVQFCLGILMISYFVLFVLFEMKFVTEMYFARLHFTGPKPFFNYAFLFGFIHPFYHTYKPPGLIGRCLSVFLEASGTKFENTVTMADDENCVGSSLRVKSLEIEAILSEDEVDLWALREHCLTSGGLINGELLVLQLILGCTVG